MRFLRGWKVVSGVMVRVLGVISRIFLILVLTHCPHALWSCSMARAHSRPPPDCSLTRQSETAGRDLGVWDSGAEPFRLQKIA